MFYRKAALVVTSVFILGGVYGQSVPMKVMNTFHVQSAGGWDYILADTASEKLYVSHGAQVNVLNKNTGDSIGIIPNTNGVHGIALVHSLNKGFTSNGRANTVTVFDIKTLAVKGEIATGENPDAIFYDDYSKKIITCNGRSKTLTVIDPTTDAVTATIPLSGKPETAVSNGAGKVFVNNEDKSLIEVVDIMAGKVTASWPLAPGQAPTGLCIDRKTNRLFAACDNELLIAMDASNGKVVAKVPIGPGCDGDAFDPATKMIYTSNGENATVTAIKEVDKDQYEVVETVPTKTGARTICIDAKSHTLYLPTADFGAPVAGSRRPPMLPGTFQVLVVK